MGLWGCSVTIKLPVVTKMAGESFFDGFGCNRAQAICAHRDKTEFFSGGKCDIPINKGNGIDGFLAIQLRESRMPTDSGNVNTHKIAAKLMFAEPSGYARVPKKLNDSPYFVFGLLSHRHTLPA